MCLLLGYSLWAFAADCQAILAISFTICKFKSDDSNNDLNNLGNSQYNSPSFLKPELMALLILSRKMSLLIFKLLIGPPFKYDDTLPCKNCKV